MNSGQQLLDLSSESDSDEDFLDCCALLLSKRKRTWINTYVKERNELGEFHTLIKSLTAEQFKNYFRLTKSDFKYIHDLIATDIQKQETNWRKPISTEEKLAVCLRYLATGNSFKSMEYSYRLGHRSVSRIVNDVCGAIWNRLQLLQMPDPTAEQLKFFADEFKNKWNFDHCFGALDGKHVQIKAPPNSGSDYFNYKKTFSMFLLAMVDANYKFIMIDVGSKGRFSDGGIFSNSFIGFRLEKGNNLPPDEPLYEGGRDMPYVAVADEAFPLLNHVMRPYPGNKLNRERSVYNYRLSRARRVVENAFGILAARWRVYYKPFEISVKLVDKVVKATCVLHNYLMTTNMIETGVDMNAANNYSIMRLKGVPSKSKREAFEVREAFLSYFISEYGEVPWQWDKI